MLFQRYAIRLGRLLGILLEQMLLLVHYDG